MGQIALTKLLHSKKLNFERFHIVGNMCDNLFFILKLQVQYIQAIRNIC